MTTNPTTGNPFHGLAEQASATLRDCLATEGLATEAPAVLPQFERAVRAAVAAVADSVPDDLGLEFALAYITGRIAKEQSIALAHARAQAHAARWRAEQHWRAAIAAERRRVTLEPPAMEAMS